MRVIDMHCDTMMRLLDLKRQGCAEGLRSNTGHVDLERMKQSGYLLQNFALFVDCFEEEGIDPWEEACCQYEIFREEMAANADLVTQVFSYEDILRNEEAGKLSAMLTVEEGAICKGEIAKLHKLYEMGARMMALSWNYPNELGHPNLNGTGLTEVENLFEADGVANQAVYEKYIYTPDTVNGLTELGREFVSEMERLGMIVDVSHMSDAGFYHVAECATKPFVASHSNARSVCRYVRNITDDMLRIVAEHGGCSGLNYYPGFLCEVQNGQQSPGTIASVVAHAKHMANVAGVDVVALGSDFDGIKGHKELPGVQSMGLLWDALCKAGFHESEVDKIFSGNVLRVYREVLK